MPERRGIRTNFDLPQWEDYYCYDVEEFRKTFLREMKTVRIMVATPDGPSNKFAELVRQAEKPVKWWQNVKRCDEI